MNLRPATPEDAVSIADLHTASWRATYSAVLTPAYLEQTVPVERRELWRQRMAFPRPDQQVLLIEQGNQLAGFACAFAGESVQWGSYLENLHVAAAFQGRGLGAALIANVAHWCAQRYPALGLYLFVNQDNVRAQRFYQSLGANNAETAEWHAPDGSTVPTFRFTWQSIAPLTAKLKQAP